MDHGSEVRPGFWQRRYLLKHYRRFNDGALAQASGLSSAAVDGFLTRFGATRSAGDLRRIALSDEPAPAMFSPAFARAKLTELHSHPLCRCDWLLVTALLVGSVLLYGVTAARTVTGEDGGELLAAAHGFGVPHPPGYPLWLILSWAADQLLPFDSVAFKVATMSFVFSAAANAIFLAVALKTIRSRLAAVTGGCLFAVSLTHWTQAVIPEVYGLNIFFFALCALLLVRLAERPTASRLLLLAFVTGLSCTNHTTAVPIAAVIAVGALLIAPSLFKRRGVVALALLLGVAPIALNLVLLVASQHQPYVDWGNPESLSALWNHMTRGQYAGMETEHRAASSYADYLRRLDNLWHWMTRQFGGSWVLILPAIGFLPLVFRQTGLWLYLTLSSLLCTIGVTRYMQYEFGREHLYAVTMFWIPPAMALAWYAAGALDVLLLAGRRMLQLARPTIRRAAIAGAVVALSGLVAISAVRDYRLSDRSGTTLIRDFGHALLSVMEPGALYFPSSDHSTFSVLYQQGVLGYRADVTLADKYGRIERELYEPFLDDSDKERLEALPGEKRRGFIESVLIRKWPGPVYFANKRDMVDVPDRTLEPVGPLFRVMTADEAAGWWKPADDGGPSPGLAIWASLQPLIDVPAAQLVDLTVQMVHGDLLYLRGFAQLRAGHLDEAIASWNEIDGDLAPLKELFNNCGSALAEHGRSDEALAFYRRALGEDPRYVTALRNTASVHKSRQEWGRAITVLRTLVDVDPHPREARLDLARLLDEQDRPLEALAEYETLAQADPSDPAPWALAGQLLQRRGDQRKAEAAYLEALRLDPRDQTTAESLSRLRQGIDLLAQQGEPGLGEDGAADELMLPQSPTIPGLPPDPAQALGLDPLRGVPVPPEHPP
jgi:Flp pilus assembly protein TadD